jgi:hypothetical protein
MRRRYVARGETSAQRALPRFREREAITAERQNQLRARLSWWSLGRSSWIERARPSCARIGLIRNDGVRRWPSGATDALASNPSSHLSRLPPSASIRHTSRSTSEILLAPKATARL